jgi:uncharacterized membrane protein
VRLDIAGTALFAATAAYAAAVFDTRAQWTGSITALALFTIGVVGFLWAFWNALQRSRAEQIAVSQLFLLLGPGIPRRVRWVMNLMVVAQVVIALITALARPNGPDGNPGSSLAVGFLVPMFGLGMNGLWAAYHGSFAARADLDSDGQGDADSGSEHHEQSDGEPGQVSVDRHRVPLAKNPRPAAVIGQNAPMTESASEFTTIAASLDAIWEVILDLERYPEWARDIKNVEVLSRDAQGRPQEVEFVASALGRSTHYTLGYDYSGAPDRLGWSMIKGDIQREITGGYEFRSIDEGTTEVKYDVIIELVVPLPGFVKRRAEVRILNTLKELKTRLEGS